MYPYLYRNQTESVPPGQYKYSNNLPVIMNQLSPNSTLSTEPVFLDHLLMNIGRKIKVVTINEKLEGILTGVAIDHIQLTIDHLNYHIRFQHITYFVGKP